jgi:hypothetical protein
LNKSNHIFWGCNVSQKHRKEGPNAKEVLGLFSSVIFFDAPKH